MHESLKRKIAKGYREIPSELRRFLRRNYPAFVTAKKVTLLREEIPVFMFHTVDSVTFEEQLDFLKCNSYRTVTLKIFMEFLRGGVHLKEPSVLLAFDDGDKSWYRVAYPLLKRYGFHAAAFVVPYYLKEQPDQGPGKGWLSWPEVIEMDRSGAIDVQSHTYYHDRTFIQSTIVDFFHPQFDHNPLGIDTPWVENRGRYTNKLKWGTPIYCFMPRLEGYPRYIDDERVRNACVSWVESQGGETFFNKPTWRRELKSFHRTISQGLKNGRYESAEEQRKGILEDLAKAKKVLEERLDKPVQHLCYPWGAGSTLSVSLSQEAGYTSNFWCTLNDRNSNTRSESSFYIPRLKDDYLFRLPGRGRKSLLQIFARKLQRRAQTLDLY